jgi:LysR family hydrogen peroxide-inducible transcriptional activator
VALRNHGFLAAPPTPARHPADASAGIKELETLIGITRSSVPAASRFTLGMRVAEKAQRILRDAEDLTDMVRAAGKPLAGELRMGVIPTIAPFLLPTLLPRLREQWPDLKLYLREETSQAACDSLHRGQLDCVLLALPFGCGEVDTAELLDDRLMVAFPPGAADSMPDKVPPSAIDEDMLLLLEDGHCLKDHALSACNRPELRAEASILGTSLHTLVQMVDNGLGMTLIPEMAVTAGILEGTRVVARPLDAEHPTRRIALVWRKGSPREKEFRGGGRAEGCRLILFRRRAAKTYFHRSVPLARISLRQNGARARIWATSQAQASPAASASPAAAPAKKARPPGAMRPWRWIRMIPASGQRWPASSAIRCNSALASAA